MKTIKQALHSGTIKENDKSPFIIAEMSGNHNGSLDYALKIVDSAAASGADAIKLQTFTPNSMTIDHDGDDFKVTNPKSIWFGRKLYDLYDEAQTPKEWHIEIFKRAKEKGIFAFSSAFDESSVDFLETLNVPAYKIASFESTDLPLIRYAANTGKPLIISTGMATVSEIESAVEAALDSGCKQLTVLKCTSSYPAPVEHANLATIPHMKELFKCEAGLSDHTMGIGVAIASTVLGASVIEKHFILSRSHGGIDSEFSMEPHELKMLVEGCKAAVSSIGEVQYGPTEAEISGREKRRSIYIVKDVKKGDTFTNTNVQRIRPGKGLSPRHYNNIIGKKAVKDIIRGTPLSWNLID